jgi:hypothetical protein
MWRFRVKKNRFQLLGANSTSRGTIVPKECHVLLVARPCYLVTAVSEPLRKHAVEMPLLSRFRAKLHGDRANTQFLQPNHTSVY